VYTTTDTASGWTQKSTPADGRVMLVEAHHGTILAGAAVSDASQANVYVSTDAGANWSAVTGMLGCGSNALHLKDEAGPSTSRFKKNAHQQVWSGAHQFFYDSDSAVWWAAMFGTSTSCDDDKRRGAYYSEDDGATWTRATQDQKYVRGVVSDSCGLRVHYSSGASLSNGSDDQNEIDGQRGVETGRWATTTGTGGSSGRFKSVTEDVYTGSDPEHVTAAAASGSYPNPTGGYLVSQQGVDSGANDALYVCAQGYGIMQTTYVSGSGTCSLERQEFGARRPAEEPKLPRTMFSVDEARALVADHRLELYDVSGRRAQSIRPGLYFQVERNAAKLITARRMVLVTR
jgi:hypothetical protein